MTTSKLSFEPLWQFARRRPLITLLLGLVLWWAGDKALEAITPAKELALVIGEPWAAMQARSEAKIGPVLDGYISFRVPKQLSYLRFADPDHGFVTPPAKFFTVGFDNNAKIDTIRMSPQVETLPLDEALAVVLDLQNQWRASGWVLESPEHDPAYDDTPAWRQAIKSCRSPSTYWYVKNKYWLLVDIACFKRKKYPDEERYLITISLGRPWKSVE